MKLIRPTIPYLIELDDEDEALILVYSLKEYSNYVRIQDISKGVKKIRLNIIKDLIRVLDPLA